MKKSLRRKLLLSGLAMGVAALSLASTTYAWFSNIDSVNAENAVVNVSVPTSLLLNGSNTAPTNEGWVTNLPLEDIALGQDEAVGPNDTVDPVKQIETKNTYGLPTYQELTLDAKKLVKEDGTINKGYTAEGYLEDSKGDVFDDIFWLKVDAGDGTAITVKPSVSYANSPSQAIDEAVILEIYSSTDGANWTLIDSTNMKDKNIDEWANFTLTAPTPQAFAIVLYLDGTNPACRNTNVTSLATYNVDINFKKVTA